MPDPKPISRFSGIVFSASELKALTGWPDALVEDYLSLFEDVVIINESVGDSATKVPSADEDNLIVFSATGDLKDSGIPSSDLILKKAAALLDNIATFTSDGDIKDSGVPISAVAGAIGDIEDAAWFFAQEF